jgi:NTP pyrophosphatase (non-canonical NTP hydrolase)
MAAKKSPNFNETIEAIEKLRRYGKSKEEQELGKTLTDIMFYISEQDKRLMAVQAFLKKKFKLTED